MIINARGCVILIIAAIILIIGILIFWRNHKSKAQRIALKKLPNYILRVEEMRKGYIDHLSMETFQDDVKEDVKLIKRLPRRFLKRKGFSTFVDTYNNFPSMVRAWNEAFIQNNLEPVSRQLAECLGTTLDKQQMRAVLTDEMNNLVIAGAGSGKTLTICGKVNYLVNNRGVASSKILLLAFNRAAAGEISNKLKAQGIPIAAMTFHKLGLEIIKEARKNCPDIIDESFLLKIIKEYFRKLNKDDIAPIRNILYYLGIYHIPLISEEDFSVAGDYYAQVKGMESETLRSQYNRILNEYGESIHQKFGENAKEIRDYYEYFDDAEFEKLRLQYEALQKEGHKSIQGEKMRSLEETVIANFLYLNGVEYEYEKLYPHQEPSYRKPYRPDFYLPEYDIYLEHFGIDKNGNVPWLTEIEEKNYKEGIIWKRRLHENKGTRLIESYSYWKSEGLFEENLDELLRNNGVIYKNVDFMHIYRAILTAISSDRDYEELCKLIGDFIRSHKEGKNCSFEELRRQAIKKEKSYDRKRTLLFLDVVEPIYGFYQQELKKLDAIDFSDMINLATMYVRSGQCNRKYEYIIVDEFQDISFSRYDMIRAIGGFNNAKFFCVGDDWQSIYRFAGSELDLLVHFSDYYGYSEVMRIEKTYRYSQEIIDAMEPFMQRNPYQLQKKMFSDKHQSNPIRLIPYDRNVQEALYKALDGIIRDIKERKEKISDKKVLLLARNTYDLDMLLWDNTYYANALIVNNTELTEINEKKGKFRAFRYAKCKELCINGTTVHRAKGAEADYVIVVRAENNIFGFPNKMADDPIMQLLRPNIETYPFAEERRLFYVAITRTKRITYVLVSKDNSSEFITELIQSPSVAIEGFTNPQIPCPRCIRGHLVLRKNANTGGNFLACSLYPGCTRTYADTTLLAHTIKCEKCGGYMVHRKGYNDFLGCSNYPICKNTLAITTKESFIKS